MPNGTLKEIELRFVYPSTMLTAYRSYPLVILRLNPRLVTGGVVVI